MEAARSLHSSKMPKKVIEGSSGGAGGGAPQGHQSTKSGKANLPRSTMPSSASTSQTSRTKLSTKIKTKRRHNSSSKMDSTGATIKTSGGVAGTFPVPSEEETAEDEEELSPMLPIPESALKLREGLAQGNMSWAQSQSPSSPAAMTSETLQPIRKLVAILEEVKMATDRVPKRSRGGAAGEGGIGLKQQEEEEVSG